MFALLGWATLFYAPLSQTARVVDALRAKVEAEGPVADAAAPAAEADAAETPAEAGNAVEADTASNSDVAEGGDAS